MNSVLTAPEVTELRASTPSSATVNTFGWDVVSAIRYSDVNAAIVAANSSPASFSQLAPVGIGITGTFGPWQLRVSAAPGIGSSSTKIRMTVPLLTLTYTDSTVEPAAVSNFTNLNAFIMFDLAVLQGGPNQNVLVPDFGSPVVLESINFANTTPFEVVSGSTALLGEWLKNNLASFKHVFATVDLAAQEDTGDLAWLNPTFVAYATAELSSGATLDNSIFGVMAMTEGRSPAGAEAAVSPFAIPDGSRAGFLISRERFLSKFLLPGLPPMFPGSSESDFIVSDDLSTVTNQKQLSFELQVDDKDDTTHTATLAPRAFSIRQDFGELLISYDRLTFDYEHDTNVAVKALSTAKLVLDSETRGFKLQPQSFQMDTSVVASQEAQEASIFTSIAISAVAAMITGFPLAKAFCCGAAVADGAEAGGAMVANGARAADGGIQMAELGGDLGAAAANDAQQAEVQAAERAQAAGAAGEVGAGRCVRFSGFLKKNWTKILAALLSGGAISGIVRSIPLILESLAKGELKGLPTLDAFAKEAVAPVQWPNSTVFTLDSVQLNNSLQLGGNPNFSQN